MAVKWRDYKCSPYIGRRYKVLVEIMLDDVIVSIFLGVGLIVQLLMGRKQPCSTDCVRSVYGLIRIVTYRPNRTFCMPFGGVSGSVKMSV